MVANKKWRNYITANFDSKCGGGEQKEEDIQYKGFLLDFPIRKTKASPYHDYALTMDEASQARE